MKKVKASIMLIMCLILFSGVSYADYGTSHIFTGNFTTSGNSLAVYEDSSVATYGYGTAISFASYEWDLASSQVSLGNTTSSNCHCIAVYVGRYVLGESVYGSTGYFNDGLFGWTQIGWTDVRDGDDFDRARITLDDGEMDDQGFSASEARHNAGHEFGHALSLDHFEQSPAHSGNHWMKSGIISMNSPSTTDKDHYTNKWGS